jgi:hypothetical protein
VNAEQTGCVDIGPTATPTPSPNNEVPVLPFPIDCLPSFYVVIYFSYGSQGQYCEKCPPGSYSSVASTVCSTCPAGSMVNTEQTECSLPGSPTFSPTSAAPSYALSQRPLLRTLASSWMGDTWVWNILLDRVRSASVVRALRALRDHLLTLSRRDLVLPLLLLLWHLLLLRLHFLRPLHQRHLLLMGSQPNPTRAGCTAVQRQDARQHHNYIFFYLTITYSDQSIWTEFILIKWDQIRRSQE